MRDYRKIRTWQLADDLTVAIYRVTKEFPREELFGMTSQLRRAAYSVPANIAEGSARESQKEYLHFLHIARASLAEVQYFVHLAMRLEYVTRMVSDEVQHQVKDVFVRLHRLIEAVKKEVKG